MGARFNGGCARTTLDIFIFCQVDGVRRATPLLLVLACIELSDIVFAVDSIPAVFGVTKVRHDWIIRDAAEIFSPGTNKVARAQALKKVVEAMTTLAYRQVREAGAIPAVK